MDTAVTRLLASAVSLPYAIFGLRSRGSCSVIERNLFYDFRGKAVFYTFSLGPHQIAKSSDPKRGRVLARKLPAVIRGK